MAPSDHPLITMVVLSLSTFTSAACPLASPPWHRLKTSNEAYYYTSAIYNDANVLYCETHACSASRRLSECPAPPRRCAGASLRYRKLDGSCNNLQKPLAGASGQCHGRLLPASYPDGVALPPAHVDIIKVFNAIQSMPIKDINPVGRANALAVMLIQFLAHDLSATAVSELTGVDKDCCSAANNNRASCSMRINVTNANVYRDSKRTCVSVVRAARCPCSEGNERQSMNTQTAYIDLSNIYNGGRHRDQLRPWRLASQMANSSGEVPQLGIPPAACYTTTCFEGDTRANLHQGMMQEDVIFVRLHNRIADKLYSMNRRLWSSERVFQEARKIAIARWQCFVYNELMDLLADSELRRLRAMRFDDMVAGTQYDPSMVATTYAEFVHSEFRGHGIVPNSFDGQPYRWLNASIYFDSDGDYPVEFAKTEWLTEAERNLPFGKTIAYEVFQGPREQLGISLLLLNIQRGRDVGLPNYATVLGWVHNVTITSYDQVEQLGVHSADRLDLLKSIYPNVEDIDLYIGSNLEKNYGSGVLSRTNVAVQLAQFSLLITSDRHFWSHRGVFTPAQRKAFVASRLYATILCEVLPIDEVPIPAITYQGRNPNMTKCASLNQFDFEPWRAVSH